ncbi:MAG: CDGSH iron-sulfur domain-containing protein [Gammaproteobacteria bacterium]|nr:CDGSH iron-sulfur domain-containing protein [Gammaproteobacteria bacterium]
MSEPHSAQKKPYVFDLKAGDYWFCTCGHSKEQPFCDGSHKGSGFTPLKFTLQEGRKVGLCGCKRSKNLPFCDGSHKEL